MADKLQMAIAQGYQPSDFTIWATRDETGASHAVPVFHDQIVLDLHFDQPMTKWNPWRIGYRLEHAEVLVDYVGIPAA